MEAFDLATQHYKEKGDDDKESSRFLREEVPDQRYKVVTALAKRSAFEAQKLMDQILEEARSDETGSTTSKEPKWKPSEKLLTLASSLID